LCGFSGTELPCDIFSACMKMRGRAIARAPGIFIRFTASQKIYHALALFDRVLNDGGNDLHSGTHKRVVRVEPLQVAIDRFPFTKGMQNGNQFSIEAQTIKSEYSRPQEFGSRAFMK